jgi:hypothetical protein
VKHSWAVLGHNVVDALQGTHTPARRVAPRPTSMSGTHRPHVPRPHVPEAARAPSALELALPRAAFSATPRRALPAPSAGSTARASTCRPEPPPCPHGIAASPAGPYKTPRPLPTRARPSPPPYARHRMPLARHSRAPSSACRQSRSTILSSPPGLIEARALTHWSAPPLLSLEFEPRRPPGHCLNAGAPPTPTPAITRLLGEP